MYTKSVSTGALTTQTVHTANGASLDFLVTRSLSSGLATPKNVYLASATPWELTSMNIPNCPCAMATPGTAAASRT